MFEFHKMHGLGNDFVVIDARVSPIEMSGAQARAIADRHTGIGCDQVIVLEPATADAPSADATMRIWNADGSVASACGNAARAIAVLIGDAVLATAGGTIRIARTDAGATVDMGVPCFDWNAVPLAYPCDTAALPVGWDALVAPAALSVGNPHLVFFVDDVAAVDLAELGPRIEHDPLFPERINVNIAQVTGAQAITMRTWERGAGLTRACGTGACATAVAAIRAKRVVGPVAVTQPGGALTIDWQAGGTMQMTGDARHVFTGHADWESFAA